MVYAPHEIDSNARIAYRFTGYYGSFLKTLVIKAKYGADPYATEVLLDLIHETLRLPAFSEALDLITSVPGVDRRIAYRGIDLPDYLAKSCAGMLSIPFSRKVLKRAKASADQVGLSRHERKLNTLKTFVCPQKLHDKTVLVIDDVYTTGSTARNVLEALFAADAKKVVFLAVARTPKS